MKERLFLKKGVAFMLFALALTGCTSVNIEETDTQPGTWRDDFSRDEEVLSEDKRKLVTLSKFMADENDEIVKAVVAFNEVNTEYYVEIQSSEPGVSAMDYWDREMIEIMAGKGPDLFSKTSEITFMTYVEKGVIEDLAPYIDREIDKEKYWECSLYAYAKDGKVYAIEPNFQISILCGNPEVFADNEGWKLEEAIEIMEAHPEYTIFQEGYAPSSLLHNYLALGNVNYTDYDAIRKAIQFAKEYSDAVPGASEQEALVVEESLRSILGWADVQAIYHGEVYPIGYINEKKQNIVHGGMGWSINAASKQKEGAWEFLKFLLSEEYQRREDRYNFSPLKVIFEEEAEYYSKPVTQEYYDAAIGESFTFTAKHVLPRASCIAGCVGEIDRVSEEQIQTVRELLERSRNSCFDWDITAHNIITEEAQSYFNNQRSLDDVMVNIQNRMELYMSEKD